LSALPQTEVGVSRTVVIVAILLLAGLSGCGEDEQTAKAVRCGDVAFTPQSDDGAFNIVATGVSCEGARRVAALTRNRRHADPLSYEADGFSCTGTRVPNDGLPSVDWRCTRNGDTITFTRS
jgi:hypothetical protein